MFTKTANRQSCWPSVGRGQRTKSPEGPGTDAAQGEPVAGACPPLNLHLTGWGGPLGSSRQGSLCPALSLPLSWPCPFFALKSPRPLSKNWKHHEVNISFSISEATWKEWLVISYYHLLSREFKSKVPSYLSGPPLKELQQL